MDAGIAIAVGFGATVVMTPLMARVAKRLEIVDRPGALKVHDRPVPYLGGVAVFCGIAPALIASHPSWLVPLAMALALGVADDVADVGARGRLACEVSIGLIAGALLASSWFGLLGTAAAVVVLINAVNLLDGLDGLASGVALVSALGFAVIAPADRVPALALAGALAAFLVYNRPPARIYLGDGGSYLVGATLAVLAANAVQGASSFAYVTVVPLLVAVPLTDTAVAVARRLRTRRPVFAGDRSHVYDQLVDRGHAPSRAVIACIAGQAALVAVAACIWQLPMGVAAALGALVVIGVAASAYALGFVNPEGLR